MIPISANTFVIDHLYHNFNFSIFLILPEFSKIFYLSFLAIFLVNFNQGTSNKHYATCLKS